MKIEASFLNSQGIGLCQCNVKLAPNVKSFDEAMQVIAEMRNRDELISTENGIIFPIRAATGFRVLKF